MNDQSSKPGPALTIGSSDQERAEHPFYGNEFTNVSSADVPEATETFQNAVAKSGPQLLDDDCYFT